jgi:hypothetical protein
LEIKGVKRLCGNISDTEVVVNSSKAEIVFHSDANNEFEGFEAVIFAESKGCAGKTSVSTKVVVTSPHFPNNYPGK